MSYYKDRLGFDPDEPTANGDGTGTTTTPRKSKRGYEENLSKFKGLSHIYMFNNSIACRRICVHLGILNVMNHR
jgi:hypothetical protein